MSSSSSMGDVMITRQFEPKMNLSIFKQSALALWPLYPTTYRSASGWSWKSVLDVLSVKQPSKELEVSPSDTTMDELSDHSSTQSREELLHGIACAHVQDMDIDSWKKASLGDAHLKGKILCDYESTFSQSIPNRDLGTINTFDDLFEILKNYTPPQESPHVYPVFGDDVTLPPNLSIQFINTAPTIKPNRRAFQNYDARHPEHSNFLTNTEKFKKQKKRRHLTALK